MYLSRLILDPRTRGVQKALADCHQMHCVVMSAFSHVGSANGNARSRLGVLYRVEGQRDRVTLLVQSHTQPDWPRVGNRFLRGHDVKLIDGYCDAIVTGSRLRFRLQANPARKIDTKSGSDGRRNGKRVELRTETEWLAWLDRKGHQHGFQLVSVKSAAAVTDVKVARRGKSVGRKENNGTSLTIFSVQFDGRLEVRDRDLFQAALRQGIGPGKAYGCGLLSVAWG